MTRFYKPGRRGLIKRWYNEPFVNFVMLENRPRVKAAFAEVRNTLFGPDRPRGHNPSVDSVVADVLKRNRFQRYNKWLFLGHVEDWLGTPLT